MKTKEKLIAGLLTALFPPIGVCYIVICKKNSQIEDLKLDLKCEHDTAMAWKKDWYISQFHKLPPKDWVEDTGNETTLKDLEGRK